MHPILTVVACGLLATAAHAESPKQDIRTAAQAPAKAKKTCRIDGATTGSIMKRKTCRTEAEWEAVDKANRLEMETRQMMRGGGGNGVR